MYRENLGSEDNDQYVTYSFFETLFEEPNTKKVCRTRAEKADEGMFKTRKPTTTVLMITSL